MRSIERTIALWSVKYVDKYFKSFIALLLWGTGSMHVDVLSRVHRSNYSYITDEIISTLYNHDVTSRVHCSGDSTDCVVTVMILSRCVVFFFSLVN